MIDEHELEQIMRFMAQNRVEDLSERDLLCWSCKIKIAYRLNQDILTAVGKCILASFLNELTNELKKRNSDGAICIGITPDGKFVKGKELLEGIFSLLSFEEMLSMIDEMFKGRINYYQRSAIIDLAYEKVYEDERKSSSGD